MSLYRWDDLPLQKLNDLLYRRIIAGEKEMLALLILKKGCVIPIHRHHNEQFSYILKGVLKFYTEPNKSTTVKEGEVFHIPPNLEHGGEALEDTVSLDIFSPIREDWLKGEDSYLRKG